ncbi:hypothetical protein [Streptomyces sp. NPDC127098]|uniref:hypothetical protein n=1 Tax=Streptomyces sp. NPDC127098 TaxID=3347137 RepID=UPI003651D5AE
MPPSTITTPPSTHPLCAADINQAIRRLVAKQHDTWTTTALDELAELYRRWHDATDRVSLAHSPRA